MKTETYTHTHTHTLSLSLSLSLYIYIYIYIYIESKLDTSHHGRDKEAVLHSKYLIQNIISVFIVYSLMIFFS